MSEAAAARDIWPQENNVGGSDQLATQLLGQASQISVYGKP